jgi:hypothetical protein
MGVPNPRNRFPVDIPLRAAVRYQRKGSMEGPLFLVGVQCSGHTRPQALFNYPVVVSVA